MFVTIKKDIKEISDGAKAWKEQRNKNHTEQEGALTFSNQSEMSAQGEPPSQEHTPEAIDNRASSAITSDAPQLPLATSEVSAAKEMLEIGETDTGKMFDQENKQ